MSQFKLLMLAFLTIGYGVCTNSVVMASGITWQATPGNLSNGPEWGIRDSSAKAHVFGAGSKKAQYSTNAATRTTTIQHSEPDTHTDVHH